MSSTGSSSPVRVLEVLVTPRIVALFLLALIGLLFWISSGATQPGRGGGHGNAGPVPARHTPAHRLGAGRPA